MDYKKVISSRLKIIVSDRNQTVKAVSEDINFSEKSLGTYINGKSLPKFDFFYALYEAGYNINWLISGEGQMYRSQNQIQEALSSYQPQQALIDNHAKSEITAFIDYWFQISSDKEKAWLEVQMERCFPEFNEFRNSSATESGLQKKQAGE